MLSQSRKAQRCQFAMGAARVDAQMHTLSAEVEITIA
jgi:hypothetical protein